MGQRLSEFTSGQKAHLQFYPLEGGSVSIFCLHVSDDLRARAWQSVFD
jgi:hypothetical protein